MIFGLLKRRQSTQGENPAESIYARIVTDARRPAFYSDLGVPDTLPGRFELIVLHMALFLRRLRREGEATRDFGQDVFEEMLRALESALRELGVGDLSVPKNMKAMGRSFYDGAAAYDAALDAGDHGALAAAIGRIIYRDAPAHAADPGRLAAYAVRAESGLASQPIGTLMSDGPTFPDPSEMTQ